MGGKRPDQYNIDPSEAGATDYDRLPQSGHGGAFKTPQEDKQQLAQSREDAKSTGVPVPGENPEPSVHARAGRPVGGEGTADFDEGRERERLGNSEFDGDEVGA